MKKTMNFKSLADRVDQLNLKEKSKNIFFNNLESLRHESPAVYSRFFGEIDSEHLKGELKISSMTLRKLYKKSGGNPYEIIVILIYAKDSAGLGRPADIDIVFEYKLVYDLDDKLKNTKLIVNFDEFEIF